MKQNLYLAASAIMLGISLPAFAAGPVFSPDFEEMQSVTVRCKNEKPQKETSWPDDIDFRLKVRYSNSKYDSMQVIICNDLWSFVRDSEECDEAGFLDIRDIPGQYDFIAILTHSDKNATTLLIKENVSVSAGDVITMDVADATSLIQFMPVSPLGEPLEGETVDSETNEVLAQGCAVGGHSTTKLYDISGNCQVNIQAFLASVSDKGKIKYGPRQADIYINEPEVNSKYRLVNVTATTTARGSVIVKLIADGLGSQAVTNTTDSFVATTHAFNIHALGNELVGSNPDIKYTSTLGYIPVWGSIIDDVTLIHNAFSVEIPDGDKLYISAPVSTDPDSPFEILSYIGTYERIDGGGTGFSGNGFGICSAPIRITAGNTAEYVHNPAANGIRFDEWTHTEDFFRANTDAFNDYLTIPDSGDPGMTWGEGAPLCLASIGYKKNSDSQLRFSFIGRYGEDRGIDKQNTDFRMTADAQTVISERLGFAESDFSNWRMRDGEFNPTDAEYKITLEDKNVIVDDLPGYNRTTIYYDTNMTSPNPPSIRSLKFRDIDGNVTDRFDALENGVLEFYAGDFEYCNHGGFNENFFNYCMLNDVVVEYSPYGAGEWDSLYPEEDLSRFMPVAYGSLYRVPLADVTAESENGWYDLRIKVYDTNDNYQIQEISPAFQQMITNAVGVVKTDLAGSDVEIYSTSGILVYAGRYGSRSTASLPQGTYIVKPVGANAAPAQRLVIR